MWNSHLNVPNRMAGRSSPGTRVWMFTTTPASCSPFSTILSADLQMIITNKRKLIALQVIPFCSLPQSFDISRDQRFVLAILRPRTRRNGKALCDARTFLHLQSNFIPTVQTSTIACSSTWSLTYPFSTWSTFSSASINSQYLMHLFRYWTSNLRSYAFCPISLRLHSASDVVSCDVF